MKRAIMLTMALIGLSGCAVSVDLKEEQAYERQALRDYHKAERAEYRAKEAAKVAGTFKAAAEASRVLAEFEKQKALADLQQSIKG